MFYILAILSHGFDGFMPIKLVHFGKVHMQFLFQRLTVVWALAMAVASTTSPATYSSSTMPSLSGSDLSSRIPQWLLI